MANRFAELEAVFQADTGPFKKGVAEVKGGFKEIEDGAHGVKDIIGGILGADIIKTGIGAGFDFLKSSIIDTNNLLQQSTVAFTTMFNSQQKAKSGMDDFAGSAQKTQAFLTDLQKFAAATPFEFPQLVDASKRMMAFGFSAEQVKPMLTSVGNATAAMGSGEAGMNRMILALGQMQAKGKVATGEMMQLVETGIPAWDMLAKKIGVDVPTAMQMVEKRSIDSSVMIEAFNEGVAERFDGMMEKQSHTFQGLASTISDTFNMLGANTFKPFFDLVTDGMQGFVDFLSTDQFQGWVDAITEGSQKAADGIRLLIGVIQGADVAPLAEKLGLSPADLAGIQGIVKSVEDEIQGFIGIFSSTGGDRAGFFEQMGFSQADANKLGAIFDTIQTKWEALVGILGSTGGDRAGFFQQLGLSQQDANKAGALLDGLQQRFQGLLDFITTAMTGGTGGILQMLGLTDATPAIDAFANALATLGTGILQALPGTLQAVASAADAFKAGLDGIGSTVADLGAKWDALGPGMQAFIVGATAGAAAAVAITAAVAAVGPVLAALPAVLGLVALGIEGMAVAIGSAVIAAAPFILIAAAIAVAVGLLAAAWATDFGGIQEKTQAAVEAIQAFASAIQAGDFASAFSGLGEAVQAGMQLAMAALNGLSDLVAAQFDAAGQAAAQAWTDATQPIADFFSDLGTMVSVQMQQVGADFQSAIQPVEDFLNAIRIIVQFFGTEFLNAITEAGSGLASTVAGWLAPFTDWGASATGSVGQTAGGIGEALGGLVEAGMGALAAVAGWLEPFVSAGASIIGGIAAWTAQVVGNIASWLAEVAGNIATGTATWLTNATEWAGNLWAQVSGPIASFISQIVGAMTGAAGQLLSAGTEMASNLISGFVGRITAGIGEAAAAVRSWAQGVIDAAEQKYGIHSPSRVFADIADQVVAGFTGGIEDGTATATAAIADLADATVDAANNALENAPSRRMRQVGDDMVYGLSAGVYAATDQSVRDVEAWINSIIGAARDALGGAPSQVFAELGAGAAKGYTLGMLGQMQDQIETAVAQVRVKAVDLEQSIEESIGDMSVQQARRVRDAVESAAAAQQKAIDATAQAQAKYDAVFKTTDQKAHDSAVAAAQDASIAADKAIQTASVAARKVQETVSDVMADNAKAVEKANEKAAAEAEKALKKQEADDKKRAQEAVKAQMEALSDFKGFVDSLGIDSNKIADTLATTGKKSNIFAGIVGEIQPMKSITDELLAPRQLKATQEQLLKVGQDWAKALGQGFKDLHIPAPTIDHVRKDDLVKFAKSFRDDLVNAISVLPGQDAATAQVIKGWWQTGSSQSNVSFVADEFGNLISGAVDDSRVEQTTIETGDITAARFVKGFGAKFMKLTAPGSKFLDKPIKDLVDQFEEAGKKAGDALRDGVVRTIAELNKLPPIDLDNLLPGGDKKRTPPGNGLAFGSELEKSYYEQFSKMTGNDIVSYLTGKNLSPDAIIGPWRQGILSLAEFQKKIAAWFAGIMATGVWSPQTGFRFGGLGEANPLVGEPTFEKKAARGFVATRPTTILTGDTRPGDPEITSPRSMMADVVRQVIGAAQQPVYLVVDGEILATRMTRRQGQALSRQW